MSNIIFKIHRVMSNDEGTISTLSCTHHAQFFNCFLIEDKYNPYKEAGLSRIPSGFYLARKLYDSPLAKKHKDRWDIPWILAIDNVPNFKHIRIHVGNRPNESLGCPMPNDRAQIAPELRGFGSVSAMERMVEFVDMINPKFMAVDIEDLDRELPYEGVVRI